MPDPRAWLFPYLAEAVPRRDRSILRPLVPITVGQEGSIRRWALIDTGAENVLAADWVADAAGVDLTRPLGVVRIGIGGQVADVAFHEVELSLHDPAAPTERISWRADVGFVPRWQAEFPVVLGQVGFLDQFTVTFSRTVAMLALEPRETFDERFESGASPGG